MTTISQAFDAAAHQVTIADRGHDTADSYYLYTDIAEFNGGFHSIEVADARSLSYAVIEIPTIRTAR